MSRIEDLNAIAAAWRNARCIQPVYAAIAARFNLQMPPCPELESPVDRDDPDAIAGVQQWLQLMDDLVQVHQLRLFLQTSECSNEPNLRALAHHHLRKPEPHSAADRDKLDFLLVQYFAHCAPSALLEGELPVAAVARVLKPVLGDVADAVPQWLEPLDETLQQLNRCGTLRVLLQQGLLSQVRALKVAAEERYFEGPALVAFARFNYLLRQLFFRLMRADVEVIRQGARELMKRGVPAINAERGGLSAQEPIAALLERCRQWKKPFQAEYSAGNPFAQMAELRGAVEAALSQHGISPVTKPASVTMSNASGRAPARRMASAAAASPRAIRAVPVAPSQSSAAAEHVSPSAAASMTQAADPALQPASAPLTSMPGFSLVAADPVASKSSVQAAPSMQESPLAQELHTVLVQLTQYLQADPGGSRKNGATIVLGNGRLGLSSWEVTAFVDGIDDYSEVIQQGVATRVLLFQAVEHVKNGGSPQKLPAVITLAQEEAVRLQEAITASRDERNIEATVTLTAASQRLGSLLEEAQKFRR